jgi:hypothetical protein
VKTILKILTCIILSFNFTSYAFTSTGSKDITLIVNAKVGGTNYVRSNLYIKALSDAGYNVKEINQPDTRVAVTMFNEINEPTVMTYVSNQPTIYPLQASSKNFVMIEMAQPMFICQSKNFTKKELYSVGIGKQIPQTSFVKLFKSLGYKVKMIPYTNSSAVYKGLLGGDVDFMVNSQSTSLQFMQSQSGKCIGQTLSEEHLGVPSLEKTTKLKNLPVLYYTIMAKNIDINLLRKDLKQIIMNNSEIVSYHKKIDAIVLNEDYKKELQIVKDSEKVWMGK